MDKLAKTLRWTQSAHWFQVLEYICVDLEGIWLYKQVISELNPLLPRSLLKVLLSSSNVDIQVINEDCICYMPASVVSYLGTLNCCIIASRCTMWLDRKIWSHSDLNKQKKKHYVISTNKHLTHHFVRLPLLHCLKRIKIKPVLHRANILPFILFYTFL